METKAKDKKNDLCIEERWKEEKKVEERERIIGTEFCIDIVFIVLYLSISIALLAA